MRLLAITSFPPSTRACNSFGYYAVLEFLEFPNVTELIVLADVIDSAPRKDFGETLITSKKLTIDRCWHYNSVKCIIDILKSVKHYNPDIVWINLQYTSFGVKLVPAFLGLCIPAILSLLRYPIVTLLHNYLGGVDLNKMGLSKSRIFKTIVNSAGEVAIRSIMRSNKIFTMVKAYQKDLSSKFPNVDVRYIRQDLFTVAEYRPVRGNARQIMTMGYFGTYKRLEILLDAFEMIRCTLPDARLVIAGKDSMHTPGYIVGVKKAYCNRLDNVEFVGYVKEYCVPNLFHNSSLVVITNNTSSGSSGVIELARANGRAVLVPQQLYSNEKPDVQSGIVLYDLNNPLELATKLIELLSDVVLQNQLGEQGYRYTIFHRNSFAQAHFHAFKSLVSN